MTTYAVVRTSTWIEEADSEEEAEQAIKGWPGHPDYETWHAEESAGGPPVGAW